MRPTGTPSTGSQEQVRRQLPFSVLASARSAESDIDQPRLCCGSLGQSFVGFLSMPLGELYRILSAIFQTQSIASAPAILESTGDSIA